MTKHKTFNELLNLLIEFIDIHKKIPSASSTNKSEKRLGNWCYQLRKKYRENKLDKNKINNLEEISIWFWNKREFNKEKCYNELKNLNLGKQVLSKQTVNWMKNNSIHAPPTININSKKVTLVL